MNVIGWLMIVFRTIDKSGAAARPKPDHRRNRSVTTSSAYGSRRLVCCGNWLELSQLNFCRGATFNYTLQQPAGTRVAPGLGGSGCGDLACPTY